MQQDSKLVQVDLQDLGYETSGRSENEAEREDASSPGDTHTHITTSQHSSQSHANTANPELIHDVCGIILTSVFIS